MPIRRALVALLSFLISSCAMSPEREVVSMQKRITAAAAVLKQGNDADSLAAAGVLLWGSDSSLALSLLDRSAALAPDRPEYAWLYLEACAQSTSCDARPLEARLLALAPNNGAASMVALWVAYKAKDDAARTPAIEQLARSDRVDIYWTTLISRLGPAVAETRKTTLLEAVVTVTGKLAAVVIPAYSAFSNECDRDRLTDDKVVKLCRAAARAMLRGDTYMTEMIGAAVAKRVWPEGSAEWKAAVDARRTYSYRSRVWRDSGCCETKNDAGTSEYVRLLAAYPREQDVFKAQMIAQGLNPDPPADWVDPPQK